MRRWFKLCNWFILVLLWFKIRTASCQCSGTPLTVTASETPSTFSSPGYPTSYANNLYCEWLVDSGTASQKVMLYSELLDLDCSFGDAVNIYDGDSVASTSLASGLCGSNLQSGEYISSDRYVLVTFTTNATPVGKGFEMTHISAADTSATGCSAEYIHTASTTPQYLTSAAFPLKYASDSSCRWVLTAPGSLSTVTVEVTWSDIETDASCRYDQLTIYDGPYICENMILHTDCSSRAAAGGATYTSTSNSILVIFTSDSSYNRYGFVVKYTATIVTTTVTTTSATTTTAVATTAAATTAASVAAANQTSTCTDNKLNTTLIIISALAGSATTLLVVALAWKIHRVVTKKKKKPGFMTVQSIAPLPPRSTFLTNRSTPTNRNALSFV